MTLSPKPKYKKVMLYILLLISICAVICVIISKYVFAKEDSVPAKVNVKLLICCHKPALLFNDNEDIFVPIHLGRDVNSVTPFHVWEATKKETLTPEDRDWLLQHMIGDNTGDNISSLNRQFLELTGTYWAWKNPEKLNNPEYIGQMTYRRQFSFTEEGGQQATIMVDRFDDAYRDKYGLHADPIRSRIDGYDMLLPVSQNVTEWGCENCYENMKGAVKQENMDIELEILRNMYPDYEEDIETWKHSPSMSFCNVFIMKRETFNEYCNMAFPVLIKGMDKVDRKDCTFANTSLEACMSEVFLNVFKIHKERTDSEFRCSELYKTFANDTSIESLQ